SDYSGSILSLFCREDLSRINSTLPIYHKAYSNTTGLPLVSSFYINTSCDRALVCNRSEIYDLQDKVKLIDFSAYDNQIRQVSFIAPLNKEYSQFFFSFSAPFDSVLRVFPKYKGYFDAEKRKLINIQPSLP